MINGSVTFYNQLIVNVLKNYTEIYNSLIIN